jgi:hypothetical protein
MSDLVECCLRMLLAPDLGGVEVYSRSANEVESLFVELHRSILILRLDTGFWDHASPTLG